MGGFLERGVGRFKRSKPILADSGEGQKETSSGLGAVAQWGSLGAGCLSNLWKAGGRNEVGGGSQ